MLLTSAAAELTRAAGGRVVVSSARGVFGSPSHFAPRTLRPRLSDAMGVGAAALAASLAPEGWSLTPEALERFGQRSDARSTAAGFLHAAPHAAPHGSSEWARAGMVESVLEQPYYFTAVPAKPFDRHTAVSNDDRGN